MGRLIIACIVLTGCSSYYTGTVTEIFIGVPKAEVEIGKNHYIWATNYDRDTLQIGDTVKIDKETLWMK